MAGIDELRSQVQSAKAKDEETQQRVTAAGESVHETGTEITAAQQQAAELAGLFAGMTMDSAAQRAQVVASRLEALQTRAGGVGEGLNSANAELAGIATELDEVRAEIDVLQGLIPGASGASDSAASGRPSSHAPVPPAVTRLAEQMPVWEEDEPTLALAFSDEDGEAVEFASGRDRTADAGLKPEYAARVVTIDHAEGHIAARMRQPGAPGRVTATINNEPCGGPLGCDATLPHIIPEGSCLTVYVKDSAGVRYFGTYRGTGKGIAT